jgi:hypothetical protein
MGADDVKRIVANTGSRGDILSHKTVLALIAAYTKLGWKSPTARAEVEHAQRVVQEKRLYESKIDLLHEKMQKIEDQKAEKRREEAVRKREEERSKGGGAEQELQTFRRLGFIESNFMTNLKPASWKGEQGRNFSLLELIFHVVGDDFEYCRKIMGVMTALSNDGRWLPFAQDRVEACLEALKTRRAEVELLTKVLLALFTLEYNRAQGVGWNWLQVFEDKFGAAALRLRAVAAPATDQGIFDASGKVKQSVSGSAISELLLSPAAGTGGGGRGRGAEPSPAAVSVAAAFPGIQHSNIEDEHPETICFRQDKFDLAVLEIVRGMNVLDLGDEVNRMSDTAGDGKRAIVKDVLMQYVRAMQRRSEAAKRACVRAKRAYERSERPKEPTLPNERRQRPTSTTDANKRRQQQHAPPLALASLVLASLVLASLVLASLVLASLVLASLVLASLVLASRLSPPPFTRARFARRPPSPALASLAGPPHPCSLRSPAPLTLPSRSGTCTRRWTRCPRRPTTTSSSAWRTTCRRTCSWTS